MPEFTPAHYEFFPAKPIPFIVWRALLYPGMAIFWLMTLASCGWKSPDDDESAGRENGPPVTVRPLDRQRAGTPPAVFHPIEPSISGLGVSPSNPDARKRHGGGFPALGGVVLGDIDGDGRDDVFVGDGPGSNQMFRQTAPLRFEDITERAGVGGGDAWGTGAAFADIDGDGDLDLYVCNFASPNQCFINDGQGVFTESAQALGLDVNSASLMPAFADYDNDGDLDLYVLTNRFHRQGGMPDDATHVVGARTIIKPEYAPYYNVRLTGGAQDDAPQGYEIYPVGQRDFLFRNRGDGTFENVSNESGEVCILPNKGVSAMWVDLDRDGNLDLYVTNEGEDGSRAYRNRGNGIFTDATRDFFPYTVWSARGSAVHDVDGDGLLDIFTLAVPTGEGDTLAWQARQTVPPPVTRPVLWQNSGRGHFRELAGAYGLVPEPSSWAVVLGDYDHDGAVDALVAGEDGLSAWKGQTAGSVADGVTFSKVTDSWGLEETRSVGVLVQGDLDSDGDLDVIARLAGGELLLFRNDTLGGSRLVVELVPTKSPAPPVGALLRVQTRVRTLVKTVNPTAGLLAGHGTRICFAFPEAGEIERFTVHWPSGVMQEVENIYFNSHVTLVEPDSEPVKPVEDVHPWYWPSDLAEELVHGESRLPGGKTTETSLGPGIACTDVNGDGLDDVYLGGAAGVPGKVFMRKSSGFREALTAPFEGHAASADQGAVFADFDADGRMDLFVVSGGVESPAGSIHYRDRLYLATSFGDFAHAPEALPDLRDSGGPVAAGDFDRDGDLDLFIGGRCSPGDLEGPGTSRLLINEYTPAQPLKFTASEFTVTGNVTSAVCSDIDGDGWIDLLFVDEWRGVRVMGNDQGKLSEREIGLQMPEGRWSAIVPWDMDNNGTIDYAVMNLSGESGILKNNGANGLEWIALPGAAQWSPARSAHWLDADGDGRQDLFVVQNLRSAGWPAVSQANGVGQVFRGSPQTGFDALTPRQSGFVIPGYATAVVVTELNGDGAPDFLVRREDAPVAALERSDTSLDWVTIRFHGPLRNVMGIGARVGVEWNGQLKLFTELYAGSGYLTQSPNRIFFARPSGRGRGTVKVTWPDGSRSQLSFSHIESSLLLRHRG